MEINISFDCDKEQEERIKKVIADVLTALTSKRHFIHISKLEDERTDIYTSECIMQNTIVMKEMSLADVMNIQKSIDKDILEERKEQYGQN